MIKLNRWGYLEDKGVRVHRIVYESYYGKIPPGYIVHHKDGNKTNNAIENLEIMTRAEHAILHHKGTHQSEEMKRKSSATKMGHPVSKETRDKIRAKLKGKPLSEETKRKMSASRMGKKRGKYKKHSRANYDKIQLGGYLSQ